MAASRVVETILANGIYSSPFVNTSSGKNQLIKNLATNTLGVRLRQTNNPNKVLLRHWYAKDR